MRKIEVVEYDENWMKLYDEERSLIREVFKDEIVEIYHIGSTSVPGLKAKPIIDIMPVVKNIENIDKYNEKMKNLGYECELPEILPLKHNLTPSRYSLSNNP